MKNIYKSYKLTKKENKKIKKELKKSSKKYKKISNIVLESSFDAGSFFEHELN